MTESLERWGDAAPDRIQDAAALYDREGPSELALARILARVELGVASAQPSGGGLWKVHGKLAAKLILSVVAIGAFVAGATLLTLRSVDPSAHAQRERARLAPAHKTRAAAPESAATPAAQVSREPLPAPLTKNTATRSPSSRKAPGRTQIASPDAVAELALLLRARRILSADPQRAYGLTDEHRARYRDGALGQERELLAIEALVALARKDAAQARAELFTRRYPASVHARRLALILQKVSL